MAELKWAVSSFTAGGGGCARPTRPRRRRFLVPRHASLRSLENGTRRAGQALASGAVDVVVVSSGRAASASRAVVRSIEFGSVNYGKKPYRGCGVDSCTNILNGEPSPDGGQKRYA